MYESKKLIRVAFLVGLFLLGSAGQALAGNDGIAQEPTTGGAVGTTVDFPMSAAANSISTQDTSWAVAIYDVEFINPVDAGLPILSTSR